MHLFRRLGLVVLSTTVLACGATTVISGNPDDDGAGGQAAGGTGGEGGAPPSCEIDAPGQSFDFVITNTGMRDLFLVYGCGGHLPIELETIDGVVGIGPGQADYCEVSCDTVYDGYQNWGCSDCGPGYGDTLNAGATVNISWDRRVYVEHVAPASCTGNADGNNCALGKLVTAAQVSGTLTVCTDMNTSGSGYCTPDYEMTVPITVS